MCYRPLPCFWDNTLQMDTLGILVSMVKLPLISAISGTGAEQSAVFKVPDACYYTGPQHHSEYKPNKSVIGAQTVVYYGTNLL